MNKKAQALMDKILELEQELLEELKEQEDRFQFTLAGTKVKFDEAVAAAHRKARKRIIPFLRNSAVRNIASVPFIYPMVIPIALLDLTITLYQQVCFRLYRIPRVRRQNYIVLDRHYLGYLNGIEKLNCLYCGYGNGVIAYTAEIISVTEQYWCPIKHARKVAGKHKRYDNFVNFGDSESYQTQVLKFRDDLKKEE